MSITLGNNISPLKCNFVIKTNADEIESIIDQSGVLDSTEGTVMEKVEVLIDRTNLTNKMTGLMFNGSNINEIIFDCSNITILSNSFQACPYLRNVYLTNTSKVKNWNYAFASSGIVTIETLDFSSATYINYQTLGYNNQLVNLKIVPETVKKTIDIRASARLSDESIQSIIDGLATVETAQTLTLHADVKAKLTEEQLTTITSKNWNLA
jgi:hypothetical protein